MLSIDSICIGAICIVLITIVGWFLWKKIGTQQETISQLVARHRHLEATLFKPPPRREIIEMMRPQKINDADSAQTEIVDDDDDACESCVLKPVRPAAAEISPDDDKNE